AEDSELARRYELVREELAETIRVNEMLGAPSARAMEKLFAAIDAKEASATRCAQETGSASTQDAVHTSASIRTTRSRPVNGRTRKRWPNKRAQQRLDEIGDRR
ncbi:MAG: hypothetical protein WCC80_24545, partial [Pseudolabrys sp.]